MCPIGKRQSFDRMHSHCIGKSKSEIESLIVCLLVCSFAYLSVCMIAWLVGLEWLLNSDNFGVAVTLGVIFV